MEIIKFKLRYLFVPSLIALMGGIYSLIGTKQGAIFQWVFGLGFLGFIGCALSVSEWGRRWSMRHWEEMERQRDQPEETVDTTEKPSL